MNKLINQDFFQITLNQFLIIDEDLIPWKFTCTSCYYYIHNIYLFTFMFEFDSNIISYIKPIKVNTTKYFTTEYEDDDSCCLITYYYPNFDNRVFNDYHFSHITHLTLSFTFYHLTDSDISCLTTLIYLDLGRHNNFTNSAIKPLHSLQQLYLRNNIYITSEIFQYLPNLSLIQLSKASYMDRSSIPQSVTTILVSLYDKICERCDIYDYEFDTKRLNNV